jgi:hypothetical protein
VDRQLAVEQEGLLSAVGVIVWLLVPARPNSVWAQRRRRDDASKSAL